MLIRSKRRRLKSAWRFLKMPGLFVSLQAFGREAPCGERWTR